LELPLDHQKPLELDPGFYYSVSEECAPLEVH